MLIHKPPGGGCFGSMFTKELRLSRSFDKRLRPDKESRYRSVRTCLRIFVAYMEYNFRQVNNLMSIQIFLHALTNRRHYSCNAERRTVLCCYYEYYEYSEYS